jgi:secreted PhoX family phosphatase
MGRWAHEAVAVDPDEERLYLTQDHPAGLLYRFTPDAYPDLSAGLLEACTVAADGSVTWTPLTDPSGTTTPTRDQVPGATVFPGNEGIWYHDGWIYFTTKGDHSVHAVDLAAQRYELIWKGDPDGKGIEAAVLSHVDNITVDDQTGDLYVAEDGANMELVIITPDGVVAPFAQIPEGHDGSEITGPCFNPDRTRLYFSSQRGPSPKGLDEIIPGATQDAKVGGITYEVTGPFRAGTAEEPESPTTTLAQAAETGTDGSDDDGSNLAVILGGAAVVVAAAGGAIVLRNRRGGEAPPSAEPDR